MKIAFLNIYQDKVARGAETFVFELSKRLSKNHQVDVISKINYLEIFKNKYDLLIPTNGRLQAVLVKVIAFLSGAKVIISGQSGVGFDDRINLYTFPDVFVALSTNALNWSTRINPLVKSVYIPNGVDLTKFNKLEGMQGSTLQVLCVGALTKQKRIDLVIKAVAKIDSVKLLVVGDGELKSDIENLGTDLLGDRFSLKSVKFEQMPLIYQQANVFTLVSAPSESFGNVFVEAMASGLPVVANDDPVRREIIGEAGIFIDPENLDEYANALKKALEIDWANKPRTQSEKFSWDKIASEYEKLFNTF